LIAPAADHARIRGFAVGAIVVDMILRDDRSDRAGGPVPLAEDRRRKP
jgi:hypothetical protein